MSLAAFFGVWAAALFSPTAAEQPGHLPAGAASSSFREIDELLDQVELLTVDLERDVVEELRQWPTIGADFKKLDNECRAHAFEIIEEFGASHPMTPWDSAWIDPAMSYCRCLAFKERDPNRCAVLRNIDRTFEYYGPILDAPTPETHEDSCRLDYRNMVLAQAIISRDPRATQICEGLFRKQGYQDVRSLCGILVKGHDAEADCPRILRVINQIPGEGLGEGAPMTMSACVKWLGQIRADEGAPSDFLTYKKALRAGDLALCGPAAPHERKFCRTMMGAVGAHCEPQLEGLQEALCSLWASDRILGEAARATDAGDDPKKARIMAAVGREYAGLRLSLERLRVLINEHRRNQAPGFEVRIRKFRGQVEKFHGVVNKFQQAAGL